MKSISQQLQTDETNSEHRVLQLLRKTKEVQEDLEALKRRIDIVTVAEKAGEPLVIEVNKGYYPGDVHGTKMIPEKEELERQREELEFQLEWLNAEIKNLKKEKITGNMTINIEKAAVNLGTMKGNSKIEMHQNFSNTEIGEMKDTISQLKQNLPKIKLEAKEMKVIIKETSQLENELKKDNPEKQIIKRKFGAVKRILEGVTSNVAAKGIIILIGKILEKS